MAKMLKRRTFMQGAVLAGGACALNGCRGLWSGGGFRKRGEMLRLGVIGAGGQGVTDWSQMLACGNVRVVAEECGEVRFGQRAGEPIY